MSDSGQTLPSEDALIYVLQVRVALQVADDDGNLEDTVDTWRDVATVSVSPRTKRRTAIERGLRDAGIEKTPELEVRVLDPAAAYVWRAKPPEPQSLRLT